MATRTSRSSQFHRPRWKANNYTYPHLRARSSIYDVYGVCLWGPHSLAFWCINRSISQSILRQKCMLYSIWKEVLRNLNLCPAQDNVESFFEPRSVCNRPGASPARYDAESVFSYRADTKYTAEPASSAHLVCVCVCVLQWLGAGDGFLFHQTKHLNCRLCRCQSSLWSRTKEISTILCPSLFFVFVQ